MTTVREHVSAARTRLVEAGVDPGEAGPDAEILARCLLGWDRATYVSTDRAEAPAGFTTRYEDVLKRREQREPVSLITGHREFWGLDFEVTPDVLAPRPETEIVVEAAISCLRNSGDPRHVVDVGTGSGCIAVAITREHPEVRMTATDVSGAALDVARRNAARHGVGDRIAWVCAPFLEGVNDTPHLIVANLPYVPSVDIPNLPPEVRDFEPQIALDGGKDGLDAIRTLLDASRGRLALGGHLIAELGAGQSSFLRRHVKDVPELDLVDLWDDLQGIPRVAIMQRATRHGPHVEPEDHVQRLSLL